MGINFRAQSRSLIPSFAVFLVKKNNDQFISILSRTKKYKNPKGQ